MEKKTWVFFLIFGIFSLSIYSIVAHFSLYKNSIKTDALEQTLRQVYVLKRQRESELSALYTGSVIKSRAKEELQMKKPKKIHYLSP